MLGFKIEKKLKNSLARAGVLSTLHGDIMTPSFVPVATKATIKSISPEQTKDSLSQVILSNTYHLYLEPGEKLVKKAGGLGSFMNWQGPTFTDSGGFQAFSLGVAYGAGISKFISAEILDEEIQEQIKNSSNPNKKANITEEGVEFSSILDGSKHFFTPEKSIQIQNDLGADVIFALDEFTSPHADHPKIKSTIERTTRWAERCIIEHKKNNSDENQLLYGIVQGGRYQDLREESAKNISQLDFQGFGIGGTFIKEDMATAVKWVNAILPEEKPRHLLGVGEPIDLFLGVENGSDTFDCVAPTRMARNGGLYTKSGKINITNAKFKDDFSTIENDCACYTCKNYTRAYLSHLFRAKEMFAATLATIHNLYFINSLVAQIRQSILDDNFISLKEQFLRNYVN